MKQSGAKIMAIFALVGIFISIVGTSILFIVESNRQPEQPQLTQEQLQDIMKKVQNSGSGNIATGSISIGSGEVVGVNESENINIGSDTTNTLTGNTQTGSVEK